VNLVFSSGTQQKPQSSALRSWFTFESCRVWVRWLYSVPPENTGIVRQITAGDFLPHPFPFIVDNHPPIRRHITRVVFKYSSGTKKHRYMLSRPSFCNVLGCFTVRSNSLGGGGGVSHFYGLFHNSSSQFICLCAVGDGVFHVPDESSSLLLMVVI
jgi:hypothetical protein